jgi:hypothetical protein
MSIIIIIFTWGGIMETPNAGHGGCLMQNDIPVFTFGWWWGGALVFTY